MPIRTTLIALTAGLLLAGSTLQAQPRTTSGTSALDADGTVLVDNHEGSITIDSHDGSFEIRSQ